MGIQVRMLAAALALTAGLVGCGDIAAETASTGTKSKPAAQFTGPRLTTATFARAVDKAMAAQKTVRMSMRVDVGGQATTVNAAIRLDYKHPGNTDMTMGITSAKLDRGVTRLVVVDGVLWATIPTVTPAGKYVRMNPKDPRDPIKAAYGGTLDGVKQMTDSAGTGLRKVQYVAREKLNGLELQHYAVTYDTATVLRQMGLAGPVPNGVPRTVVQHMWLDPDRLMRRYSLTLGTLRTVMTAASYGQPVDIAAPAASDVVKLSDLKRKIPA